MERANVIAQAAGSGAIRWRAGRGVVCSGQSAAVRIAIAVLHRHQVKRAAKFPVLHADSTHFEYHHVLWGRVLAICCLL